jgi:uncharacterized membrane protein YobD (UPF0266 family)
MSCPISRLFFCVMNQSVMQSSQGRREAIRSGCGRCDASIFADILPLFVLDNRAAASALSNLTRQKPT